MKKIISILLIINILFASFFSVFAKNLKSKDVLNLKMDHQCLSVLKIKGKDMLKGVAYVCYEDPETKTKYPAFCVEPEKKGIGTGAGNFYDVSINELDSPILWRMLYKGYVGTNYKDWGLECDDDLYYATKTAVHCLMDASNPKGKYEEPHRVGYEENATYEEVLRRGKKVLEVAEEIYNYARTSTDNFIRATAQISEQDMYEKTINGEKFIIQNYSISANKELCSYEVSISKFPEGTKIFNSLDAEKSLMENSTFKIAIPEKSITESFIGTVKVNNAQIKSYPVFYCYSGNTDTQDYILSGNTESINLETNLRINAENSTLKIVKTDDENKPIEGAIFNLKYEDGTNIGDYKTDENGTITLLKLKPGNIIATEISVPDKYILDKASKNIVINYNSTNDVNIINDLKRGNLKIIKVDKDNNEICIPNVEFELLNEKKEIINNYKTDENGEIYISNLKIGDYYIRETEENTLYYPIKDEIKVVVEQDKTTIKVIENELKKGKVKIIKKDEEDNEIKLKGVKFEILRTR